MLYEIYTSVKTRLSTILGLKGVEWYNVQYESAIATTPRVFIEFPEALSFVSVSKEARRTPLKLRLHVVSQAIALTDGTVDDQTAADHEVVATSVQTTIEGFVPVNGSAKQLTSPLRLGGWQHFHKHKGWMVTFVEFDARMLLE